MVLSTSLVALLLLVSCCEAHMRWKKPSPRSQDAGLKSYPCGGVSYGSGTRTTLAPGPQILEFEETISHAGAPFRIALSYGDDSHYDEIVLVDQIPHNDAGGLGSLTPPKRYKFNVTIPDIACASCSLQIMNPMTDKLASSPGECAYPSAIPAQSSVCSSVYHSCADIAISGSGTTAAAFAQAYTSPTPTPYKKNTIATWTSSTGGTYELPASADTSVSGTAGSVSNLAYDVSSKGGTALALGITVTVATVLVFGVVGTYILLHRRVQLAKSSSNANLASSPSPSPQSRHDEYLHHDEEQWQPQQYEQEHAAALPEPWAMYHTEEGIAYYVNEATGATQWEPPLP